MKVCGTFFVLGIGCANFATATNCKSLYNPIVVTYGTIVPDANRFINDSPDDAVADADGFTVKL